MDLIRQTNPDVILTHDKEDYVHDHSNVGELTYRAAIWASVANIPDTEYPPIDHIPTVFYFETLGTHRVAPPDHYVDITEEFDRRLRLLNSMKANTVISLRNNSASKTFSNIWKY